MRVYAIHFGSYSDQSWGPVFSTPEKALEYIGESKEASIEVYTLDDERDTGPVYPRYRVVFDSDGNVLHWEKQNDNQLFEPLIHRPYPWLVPTAAQIARASETGNWASISGYGVRQEYPQAYLVVDSIYAPDKAHAVKIAADVRFQYLATRTEA